MAGSLLFIAFLFKLENSTEMKSFSRESCRKSILGCSGKRLEIMTVNSDDL